MNLIDLAKQVGLNPKWVASTEGGEYHSACPVCGGNDRLFMHPAKQKKNCLGYYTCRKCGIHGDSLQFAMQFAHYTFPDAFESLGTSTPISYKKVDIHPEIKQPTKQWTSMAQSFIDRCSSILLDNKEALSDLAHRGISSLAVQKYQIGYSHRSEWRSRSDWGLQEDLKEDGTPRMVWMPAGLVIPTYHHNLVARIKIRRSDWTPQDTLPKYVCISGSMNGMNIIGCPSRKVVIIVESELDAYAIDSLLGDKICAIAIGSNAKNCDTETHQIASNAKVLLICHDNDLGGKKMLLKWRNIYPKAIPFPTPHSKDVGDAIRNGLDITQWLSRAL